MRAVYLVVLAHLCLAGVPTIDDLLNLRSIGGAEISPDGKFVAYSQAEADFEQDAMVTQIWVAETATGRRWQLTRAKQGAGQARWSPDGKWLAFTSSREGGKNQIFVIAPDGGEAQRLTKAENGVGSFDWSDDGKTIAFLASEKQPEDRRKHLGEFEVVRRDYAHQHLWTLDVEEAMKAPVAGKQRTKGKAFSVGGFHWAPDGTRIAFSATVNPDLVNNGTSDIYVLALAGDSVKKIVDQAGPDRGPRWSPDGKRIVFSSAMKNPKHFHANSRLVLVSADGGAVRSITDSFDESPNLVEWNREGVYFVSQQKTASHLFRVNVETGKIEQVSKTPAGFGVSLTADGKRAAMTMSDGSLLDEVYVTDVTTWSPKRLTNSTEQVKGWTLPVSEVISWKSRDGTVIEGVLTKPKDFDPGRKYPLLCVIHGGPTGVDTPRMVHPRYYPIDIWAGRGALALRVNYRGSAGYGEKFRQLNVRNLGVGDAWDVESGVEHLIGKGWVDPQRMGVMGWSQGGYISAFLATSSTMFAAVSVGAGISNWATYYYNTDITPFTIQYLGADPAADPDIYQKTSPMTYIQKARTPTLIQHGELDKRVPIPNAYELRQGLEDRGVPVEMIVYKGFGHGITKPKSMRAVMQHNLDWFNHHLWGESKPDFANPQVPKAKEEKEK
ncbi:MAG: S9 family peptidase [Acidimicrobiia bacterium]|nr:S9 family peptidase [Acidimicrobiia bacterium]